jgi:hypothetical protein
MTVNNPILKAFGFLLHLVMIVIVMEIAQNILIAHANRVWVYTPLIVQLAGVLVYMILLYLIKRAFRK